MHLVRLQLLLLRLLHLLLLLPHCQPTILELP
jgi:hypothetical protein